MTALSNRNDRIFTLGQQILKRNCKNALAAGCGFSGCREVTPGEKPIPQATSMRWLFWTPLIPLHWKITADCWIKIPAGNSFAVLLPAERNFSAGKNPIYSSCTSIRYRCTVPLKNSKTCVPGMTYGVQFSPEPAMCTTAVFIISFTEEIQECCPDCISRHALR